MKKARNFWRDLPQGGSRYGSVLTRLFLLLCLLATTQAGWADTKEFVAGTSSGQFSQTTTLTDSPVTLTTNTTGANANSRNMYKEGSSSVQETAIQISSSAQNDPTKAYLEVKVASGYKITGVTIRGCIAASSGITVPAFCWADDYSAETGAVTGTGSFTFQGNAGESAGCNVSMTGIVDGTRTIRIYKQVKYNSSTNTIGNVSGASNVPSSASTINIAKVTVTYEAVIPSGPTAPTFSPVSGTTVSGSQTITIDGPSGSTIYYAWATSAQDAAAIYNSGSGSHGTADAGTATTTVESGKMLYAIARKNDTNSTVASASYTVDTTAPTLSSANPANGATGVGTSGTIVLTFNEAIASVDATKFSLSSGSKDGVAIDGSNNKKVNITYSGMANNTAITLTTAAGAVTDAVGNTSAALDAITFTTAAAVPTIAFNNPTTTMKVGDADITTNTATLTNATGTNINYTSDNTDVATVNATTGAVHAVAAGSAKITATYTQGGTDYTANYTLTVKAASVASTKWNFTTLSDDEITAMRANVTTSPKTLKENKDDKYFSSTGWTNSNNNNKFVGGDGNELNVTEGLTFGKSGGSLSAADIRYYYGDGDKRIFIKSSNEYVQLPEQNAETEITISWRADGGSRTLTPVNATLQAGSATISTSGQTGTSTFVVDAKGTVQFKVNGNVSLFSITVGSSVTVAAPTIAPASGTHEGENNKSVTFTQNANNTGGTLTTHYVVGTAAATSAATVAASPSVTSGTPETIDLSSYETDVVISAVTKFVDGSSNTYYSPITTATYTYAGKVTPSVVGTEMDLHPGDFGDIIGNVTITDAQGNPLRFGIEEGEEVNYEDYFTFTYSIDSGSQSAASTAGVSLDGGRLTVAEAPEGKPTTGDGIKINITAVPKAAAADYVKGETGVTPYTGSLYAKVTPKGSSGFGYVGLYWDKDLTDASELKENTDYTATTISDLSFYELTVPNGRMLYLKNTGAVDIDDLCFYYKQSSSTPSMSLNHVDNKSGDQYNYRHGIPLITSNDGAGTVWIMIAGYKNTGVDSEGKKIWSRDGSFLRLKVNITAQVKQTAPIYKPENATAHMNTSKPATAYTVDTANGNKPNDEFEILSKFTSVDKQLAIIDHVNNSGTIYGVGSTSVYSTEVAQRQISGVQTVKMIDNGKTYYYISNMSTKTYTFDFGTTLHLSEQEINVTTDGTTVTPSDVTEPTVTGTYWDKKQEKDVEISYANEYITYEVIKSPKTDESTPVNGVTINDASTGAITIDPNTVSGEAIIKVTYAGGYDESTGKARTGSAASKEPIEITTDKKRTGYTGAASTTYTINITNTKEHVPDIDPAGRKFANTLNVTVSAPDAGHFVRYYVSNGDEGTSPKTADWLKANGKLIDKGNRATTTIGEGVALDTKITVYAVAYSEAYTSRVVQETYEKVKPLPKPVFNPDGTETPYYYYNTAKLLEVTIMGTDGADIFYTFDDPNVSTASTPYDGQKKARVEGSQTIYAIAVKDGLQSEVAASRYVWTLDIDAPVFYLGTDETILYPATAKTKEVTRNTDINLKATQGDIYYTLDGSDPSTDNGIKYTAGTPIHLLKSVTAKAIAIDGDAISPITTMNFTIPEPAPEDNDLWEAVEETTPGGTLPAGGRVISIAKNSPKAVKYITATFGGGHREVLGNSAWSKISIGEESQGSALDGVGKYSISVGSDVADETGAIYNHANAEGGSLKAVSERTFKIPAQGAFVRFEPERDGELTIWALQSGALHYTTKGEFCDKFIRRRPVYLIDEQGKSVKAKEMVSSARLSSNWDNLKPDEFLGLNGSQNGDINTFYTSTENTAIYTMYEKILAANTEFGVGKAIHPVPMHTSAIYNAENVGDNGVGDNIIDGTGYVMLSGGYVKYTFDVKAGKTYYFFGSRTKLGIRGFRFVADDTTPVENITLTEEATTNSSAISGANATTRHTTGFDRKFTANTWAALVLPFSLSETQTKQVFGDDVQILHVDKVQNYYLNLVRHYYQMIVAGTPIFIKPSQEVDLADLDQYVQIESTSPETISIDGYNFTGYFNKEAAGIAKGDYYMSKAGNLSQRTNEGTIALKSLRSILKSKTQQTAKLTMAQGVIYEVDQQPLDEPVVTPIEVIYDEATGDFTIINDDTIYNLNGQVVRKNATSLEGLPKGIYIVNGKKVSVK